MNAIHSTADWLTQQLSFSLDFAHLQILILPVFTAALEPPKSSASASGPSAGPAERPATASEGVLDAQLVAQFFDSALRFGELKAPSAEELSEEGKDVEALLLQGNAAGGPNDSTHHLVRLPVHLPLQCQSHVHGLEGCAVASPSCFLVFSPLLTSLPYFFA
jgi:hypothetical protein